MNEWISVKERLPDKDGTYLVVFGRDRIMKLALFIHSWKTMSGRDFYGGINPGFFIVDDASGAIYEVDVGYWLAIPPIPLEVNDI